MAPSDLKDHAMSRKTTPRKAVFASVALLAAGLFTAGSLVAQQQDNSAGAVNQGRLTYGHGGMMMMGRSCPVMGMMMGIDAPAFGEGRIAFLKAELAIGEAQKAAWEAYAEALKRNFENVKSMRQTMAAAQESRSPVERLDAHITAMEGRLASLRDIRPSLTAFYETLSTEQRRTADALLTGMGCMI
jgi:hypothetical protein